MLGRKSPDAAEFSLWISGLAGEDPGLFRGDEFVEDAAPAELLAEERGNEIHQIQERQYQGEEDVNPGLGHDLALIGRNGFDDANDAYCAADGGEQQGKSEQRGDMERGTRSEGESDPNIDAEKNGETVESMSGEGHGPRFRLIDASDANLAIGEFQETGKGGLDERDGKAFGKKGDEAAAAVDSGGQRVVVAEGGLPDIEHAELFEDGAANGGPPAPTKIIGMIAEHGHDGRVPSGEERGGKIHLIRNEPAHGAGGADAGVGKRRDHVVQPGFTGAAVGIDKHEDIKFGRKLLDGEAKIVDLFRAIGGRAGDEDVGFDPRTGGDALDDAVSGIGLGGEDEEDFIILMIELAEGNEIAFEAGLHAATGTDDGGARGIKAGVGLQSALDVAQPLNALPKQVETRGHLKKGKNVEQGFHVT